MVDALAVQAARAADQAVDFVVGLAQEQLGEIGPVLAGDSRDQCTFHGRSALDSLAVSSRQGTW